MKIRNLIPAFLVASTPLTILTACSKQTMSIAVNAQTKQFGYLIADAITYTTGQGCNVVDGVANSKTTIVLDDRNEEVKKLAENLTTNQYEVKYYKGQLLIAAHTGLARNCAIDCLLTEYLKSGGLSVPSDLDIKGECKPSDYITELYSNIVTPGITTNKYRDPFIYREDNTYYMLATGTTSTSTLVGDDDWHLWKASGAFNDPSTQWNDLGYVITAAAHSQIKGDKWAPELYKYTNPDTGKEQYYIFTTFATKEATNEPARGRGCAVFRSDKLVNDNGEAVEFELISYYGSESNKGRITDPEQSCIDGHLFIDNGKPYMVYVREFTDYPDAQNGRMYVGQLSNDLTHFVGEAKELFKATDAPWVSQRQIESGQFRVTDGPFIYKLSNGKLLMLWSSYFDAASKQYCMGYATADNIMGPWTHHKRLVYDEYMLEGYKSIYPDMNDFSMQGGHGMIFTDPNDKMYMCIHCGAWDKKEHPFILPIKEAYGSLVWDLYRK